MSSFESDRPFEWLRALHEGAAGYAALLGEGGVLVAAYRVARARARAAAVACGVPTTREVRAAWTEIVRSMDGSGPHPPSVGQLGQDCTQAGLLVIV